MSTPTLTVVTEWGTFTRSTHHKYTHLVVTLGSDEAYLIARSESAAKHDRKLAADYAAKSVDNRFTDAWRADYQRWSVQYSVEAAGAPERLAERLQSNRETVAQKRGDAYGWSGSLRNAQKMAQRARSRGRVVAAIVEVK